MPKLSISFDGPAGREVKRFASMAEVVAHVRELGMDVESRRLWGIQREQSEYHFHGFDWYDIQQAEAAELACGGRDRWEPRFGGGWNLFRDNEYAGQVLGTDGDWSAYIYPGKTPDPDYDPNIEIGRGYPDADTAKRAVVSWLQSPAARSASISLPAGRPFVSVKDAMKKTRNKDSKD